VNEFLEQISTTRVLSLVFNITGWANKNRTFLYVDNFAMVSGRKACDMSKVC